MNNINEIFGHPLDSKEKNALSDFTDYSCRFINRKCDKESRLITYPMGVCSVNSNDNKPIICPHRFLQDNLVFINASNQAFGDTNNVLLFSEIHIKNVGSFDFVLVKHKPLSSDIEDFCVVEFQSDSTTGTGKLVQALKDFMDNDKDPEAQKKHYAFGMNTYNTIKLSYIQMLVKAQVLESWNKKIFWVMQNFVFDNMVSRFHLSELEFNENRTTQYHIYDLEKSNNLYHLSLINKYSTTVSNLLKAFTHQPIPSKEDFINLLKEKINLKVGLTLTK
jgi:hypothetical protein